MRCFINIYRFHFKKLSQLKKEFEERCVSL